ncbi:hypothetical protein DLH72_01575 [Candidatus Gracilibacteria bacterium]|nr:MAG: hypothetical protein DLH72_01575 [Candidatus Gracilibacteria bacterium]
MIDNFLRSIRENLINGTYNNISGAFEKYAYVFLISAINLIIGIIISILVYKIIIYLFKKFKIVSLIDKLTMVSIYNKQEDEKSKTEVRKISDNIKIDVITAKSMAYYVFLLFFRYSIVILGISEVEKFLDSTVEYLPSLFIGVVIGFFGIRFANFIYDVIYYPLDLSGQKNAEIIAMGGKVIILFFTLMVVLSKVGIATEITNIILIGFVAMLSIAGGLAFGLGGKDLAKEILESFKKEEK